MAKGKKREAGEGTVRWHKSGLCEARLPIPGGSSKSFYGKTQAETISKRDTARVELLQGSLSFDAEKLTFGEYLLRWLEDSVRGSVKEQTYDVYEARIRLHMIPLLGSVKLSKFTPAHLQGLYRKKLDAGLSPKTVDYIHTVANRALRQAERWRLIPRNPAQDTGPPRATDKEIEPLTPESVLALLRAARGHRLEALVVVALFTGLRVGELAGLRWSDVDLKKGTLKVGRQLIRPKSGARLDTLKSKAAMRSVYLPPQAVDALKKHRAHQLEEKLKARASWDAAGDLVFRNPRGKMLDTSHVSDCVLRPLLEAVGVPTEGVRFHDLRHTFATLGDARRASSSSPESARTLDDGPDHEDVHPHPSEGPGRGCEAPWGAVLRPEVVKSVVKACS